MLDSSPGKKALFLLICLVFTRELPEAKSLSTRSYAPLIIRSFRISDEGNRNKKCIIDADFRNFTDQGLWIIFSNPADFMKKGNLLFKGEGKVRFRYCADGEEFSGPGGFSTHRLMIIEDSEGTGIRGIYLEPGVEVRIRKFVITLRYNSGPVRVLTSGELKVNGRISLKKWIADMKMKESGFPVTDITTKDLKRVEASGLKSCIYLLK